MVQPRPASPLEVVEAQFLLQLLLRLLADPACLDHLRELPQRGRRGEIAEIELLASVGALFAEVNRPRFVGD